MTDLKSRLTAKRKDVTGRWVSINPDGDDAVKEIERLEDCCTEWAEVSQGNYQAAKKAEAEVARLREALDPNFTKADYIGEFKFTYVAGRDDDGTEIYEEIYVPWTTIKEIMAAIRDRAALKGGDENGK